ncbi:hypothetical protein PHMEG_00021537 [Phytophthora megakarya]|uniref:Tf2-1-like SH3-like domain-containing protein n=1 Tax=Phytophthora megakarya TaxID=4795 RepID=A0A225VN99_9STRA|nr:hypothetical protein PHMEG_00021537 [Phytophthora megakarya]
MAEGQDVQKEQANARGRGNVWTFEVGDRVLLNAKNLPTHAVSAVFKTKLRPRFIGPFTVVTKKGLAYTLTLPKKMRAHPVFYVGLLTPYHDPSQVSSEELAPAKGKPVSAAVCPEDGQPDEPAQGEELDECSEEQGHHSPGGASALGADPARTLRPRPVGDQHGPPSSQPPRGQSGSVAFEPAAAGDTPNTPRSGRGRPVPRVDPAASRRPPALLDEHGQHHYLVERLLKRRR